jgi:hypothetical protein
MVELPTRRTTEGVSSFTPFIGDCGVGAVAFSVEPSGLALASPGTAALGEDGLGVDFPHEPATANAHTTKGTNQSLRFTFSPSQTVFVIRPPGLGNPGRNAGRKCWVWPPIIHDKACRAKQKSDSKILRDLWLASTAPGLFERRHLHRNTGLRRMQRQQFL